jgi:hypothetical protein
MIYFLEIQAIENEVQELKDLVDRKLIKRVYDDELIYALLEENIQTVQDNLKKYEEDYAILNPLEYADERYGNTDYKITIDVGVDENVTVELSETLDYVEEFTEIDEIFNDERAYKVYNSNNIESCFKELLELYV